MNWMNVVQDFHHVKSILNFRVPFVKENVNYRVDYIKQVYYLLPGEFKSWRVS